MVDGLVGLDAESGPCGDGGDRSRAGGAVLVAPDLLAGNIRDLLSIPARLAEGSVWHFCEGE